MITDLIAINNIRGQRIDLAWTWTDFGAVRPGLRLVRRRRAYPVSVADGLTVVDADGLFRSPDQGWARIDRVRFQIGRASCRERV